MNNITLNVIHDCCVEVLQIDALLHLTYTIRSEAGHQAALCHTQGQPMQNICLKLLSLFTLYKDTVDNHEIFEFIMKTIVQEKLRLLGVYVITPVIILTCKLPSASDHPY